jgi:C-terminal processing protease CtpA/Prc
MFRAGEPEQADGQVFIKSVVPGGPCDRDGIIKAGDHVLAVNSESCAGLTVAATREKILGCVLLTRKASVIDVSA